MKPMSRRPREITSTVASCSAQRHAAGRGPNGEARRHGGRGRVMLVEHDVEAELVAQQPLVVIAVKKIGRDLGIEKAVRPADPQRHLVLLPGVRVALLGEVIDAHGMGSGRYEAAKARTRSAKI